MQALACSCGVSHHLRRNFFKYCKTMSDTVRLRASTCGCNRAGLLQMTEGIFEGTCYRAARISLTTSQHCTAVRSGQR